MTKKIVLQVESEYGEILQQAVAVIKQARVNVARQLNVGENAAYWEIGKMLQSVALLTWGQNLFLLSQNFDDNQILFYANECIAKGWTRDLLMNAVKMQMYEHAALKGPINNFKETLAESQATFANEAFRSTYNLGFLGITEPVMELERGEGENRSVAFAQGRTAESFG